MMVGGEGWREDHGRGYCTSLCFVRIDHHQLQTLPVGFFIVTSKCCLTVLEGRRTRTEGSGLEESWP